MSQEGKIIDYLGENKFVILLPEEKKWDGNPNMSEIIIAHDYVQFTGPCDFEMELKQGKYPYEVVNGAQNWRSSNASIQIPIRDMIEVILPLLKENKFLQECHLEDRIQDKDDPYFEKIGLSKPRYYKGDSYPSYAYYGSVICYRSKNGTSMVKFRRKGSKLWENVTLSTFELIKDTLKLSYDKFEFKDQI